MLISLSFVSSIYAQQPSQPAKAVYRGIAEASRGSVEAPITIIEFSDFECPFCGRVGPIVGELLKSYPGQLHFIFKHYPLSIHPHAPLAHEAALAAGAQGKFWEMHDLLFSNQQRLGLDDLIEYAKQLNLDSAAFRAALETHVYRPLLEQDLAEARGLGVTSTPTFFVNGRKILGAQSLDAFKQVINQELGLSTETRKEISIGQAPLRGSPSAPITIVEFSDFQCPFCARALPTLQELFAAYPGKIKWVFKNFPLGFHQDSSLAHQAALAAGAQGKFWEMHDRIFADQRAMKRDDLIRAAKDLGLDVGLFTADLDSGRFRAALDADKAEGARLGVDGTPTFFINGKELAGAASFAEFKRLVDGEIQTAGLTPAAGSMKAMKAESQSVDSGPTKGPGNAPVTLVWYSDLESPLTPNAAELVQQVLGAYPGKVRLVFKNRPLEFHAGAELAHEAALAAGVQGKFWPMHDLILENQKALTKEDLLGYASRLGLDREKFRAALEQRTYRQQVNDDLAEARKLGVFGVPVFLVNGKRVDGVQPLAMLKELIDSELRRVQVASANR